MDGGGLGVGRIGWTLGGDTFNEPRVNMSIIRALAMRCSESFNTINAFSMKPESIGLVKSRAFNLVEPDMPEFLDLQFNSEQKLR